MNLFRRRSTTPNPRILTLDRGRKNADTHARAGQYMGNITHVLTYLGRTYPVNIDEPENANPDSMADFLHQLADEITDLYGAQNAAKRP